MATVTRGRGAGGRPPTTERSPAYYIIHDLAAKRGMNIEGLADAAAISPTTIYLVKDPKVSTVRKIAAALGMKTGKLAELLEAVESDA
jgi:hypothetical protein